jgi:hypothetical protein
MAEQQMLSENISSFRSGKGQAFIAIGNQLPDKGFVFGEKKIHEHP